MIWNIEKDFSNFIKLGESRRRLQDEHRRFLAMIWRPTSVKFKALNNDWSEWVVFDFLDKTKTAFDLTGIDRSTICMGTGLQDADWVDIYENDIIVYKGRTTGDEWNIGIVKFADYGQAIEGDKMIYGFRDIGPGDLFNEICYGSRHILDHALYVVDNTLTCESNLHTVEYMYSVENEMGSHNESEAIAYYVQKFNLS